MMNEAKKLAESLNDILTFTKSYDDSHKSFRLFTNINRVKIVMSRGVLDDKN